MQVKNIGVLTGHKSSIYKLALSPDSRHVISAGGDGMVVQWNAEKAEDGILLATVGTQVFSVAFMPQKKLIFLGQMNGGIHVADYEKKVEIKHLALHENSIFDLQLIPWDHEKLFVSGGDGMFSLWEIGSYNLIRKHQLSEKSLRRIAFNPFKKEIAIASSDHQIYILDEAFRLKKILKYHKSSVFTLAYAPDGEKLLAGSRDAHLSIWETENYELEMAIPAHMFSVNQVVYHSSGKWFASASRDKTIRIWDAQKMKLLKVLEKEKMTAHKNSVNDIVWISNPDRLISCSDDRTLMIWETNI